MEQPEVSFDEKIHASAVQFLIQENDREAAMALLSCTFELSIWNDDQSHTDYNVLLRGPRQIYEVLNDDNHRVTLAVAAALDAVMPWDCAVHRIYIRSNLVDAALGWKAEMLDIALGKVVHNQGITIKNQATMIWQNLRFRSESEKRIAQALDRAGVLFLPNCLARITTPEGRNTKEPDFVVCHQGRWGILEVDGEPFHPPTRTVEDHKRDRDFRKYGIQVEHFDASECYQQPDRVVKDFLDTLMK
ncbi:MAG TPA: hypothetical protein VNG51_10245 [Ktedonobacteraceae bacterium]|nr:hypothetical protein [Ktedonobacteraceae bacterium]